MRVWEWRPYEVRGQPVWRLHVDDETLAAVGGAPCFNHPNCPGQIGYIIRERGKWHGRVELTPYRSLTLQNRATPGRAKADVELALNLRLETRI